VKKFSLSLLVHATKNKIHVLIIRRGQDLRIHYLGQILWSLNLPDAQRLCEFVIKDMEASLYSND